METGFPRFDYWLDVRWGRSRIDVWAAAVVVVVAVVAVAGGGCCSSICSILSLTWNWSGFTSK